MKKSDLYRPISFEYMCINLCRGRVIHKDKSAECICDENETKELTAEACPIWAGLLNFEINPPPKPKAKKKVKVSGKRKRKLITGKFDTREELVQAIVDGRANDKTFNELAGICGISISSVQLIAKEYV